MEAPSHSDEACEGRTIKKVKMDPVEASRESAGQLEKFIKDEEMINVLKKRGVNYLY